MSEAESTPLTQDDSPNETPLSNQPHPPETQSPGQVLDGEERFPGDLDDGEIWWKDQYKWLEKAGYRLRSRYHPDWTPSWKKGLENLISYEDAQKSFIDGICHATQVATGKFVVLKRVDESKYPRELAVMKYLAEEPLASNSRNHSVHPIAILEHPEDEGLWILVIPLLRRFDNPPFETMGEALDFILQFLTAVHFLHEHRVVHGDLSTNNILMDASKMYPDGFHPCMPLKKPDWSDFVSPKGTRTEKPPTYYLIDFGISMKYDEGDDLLPDRPGTDVSAPEWTDKNRTTINPFLLEVYCVGNLIRQEFLDGDDDGFNVGYYNFEFLRPLITDMINPDPEKRPTMEVALSRFEDIVRAMSSLTLRSRCRRKNDFDDPHEVVIKSVRHWYKRLSYVLKRLPPVPSLPSLK